MNYVARVVSDLNQKAGVVGTLLDEIGNKVNTKRNNGETDKDYKARLIVELQRFAAGSKAYQDNRVWVADLAAHNGVTVANTDSIAEMVEKMLRSQSGVLTQKLRLHN